MTCDVIQTECMRIGDRVPIVLDFSQVAARLWRKGALFTTSQRVRSAKDTGFEFEATTGGQSGKREPRWPKAAAQTVLDGSITWTARAVSVNSLRKTLVTAVWDAPASITISGEALDPVAQTATAYIQPTSAGEFEIIVWATFSDAPAHVEGFAIAVEVQ